MAWIESHQALGHHPKTERLAQLLKVRVPEAVGVLHFLWWWALDYAPNGLVAAADKPVVARACLWHRKPGDFWDALLAAGFVEEAGLDVLKIHDWDEYGGKLVESRELRKESNRRAAATRRQRLHRNGVSAESALTSRDSQQSTVHYTTLPDTTVPERPPLPPHQVSADACCILGGLTQGREHQQRCPSLTTNDARC
jgi:hypothetical protein